MCVSCPWIVKDWYPGFNYTIKLHFYSRQNTIAASQTSLWLTLAILYNDSQFQIPLLTWTNSHDCMTKVIIKSLWTAVFREIGRHQCMPQHPHGEICSHTNIAEWTFCEEDQYCHKLAEQNNTTFRNNWAAHQHY